MYICRRLTKANTEPINVLNKRQRRQADTIGKLLVDLLWAPRSNMVQLFPVTWKYLSHRENENIHCLLEKKNTVLDNWLNMEN